LDAEAQLHGGSRGKTFQPGAAKDQNLVSARFLYLESVVAVIVGRANDQRAWVWLLASPMPTPPIGSLAPAHNGGKIARKAARRIEEKRIVMEQDVIGYPGASNCTPNGLILRPLFSIFNHATQRKALPTGVCAPAK
jgi:hypothetical protein